MSKPSREAFIVRVAELAAARFPGARVEPVEGDFALKVNGLTMSLENLYRLAADEGDELAEHVERWVRELLAAAQVSFDATSLDSVRERVMPVVLSSQRPAAPEGSMVRQNLVEGLDVAYAIDSERSIAYIPRRLFERWAIDLDDLHELALTNLVKRSEEIAAHADQDEETGELRLIMIQTLDGYDASRILLPTLHEKLREHLGSPFVAAIPNRDVLICFRDEPEVVTRVGAQVANMHRDLPHQVSPKLFLITADGVAPYVE